MYEKVFCEQQMSYTWQSNLVPFLSHSVLSIFFSLPFLEHVSLNFKELFFLPGKLFSQLPKH